MLITRILVFSHNFFPQYNISFPNAGILDWSKSKEVADNNSSELSVTDHTTQPGSEGSVVFLSIYLLLDSKIIT